MTINAGTDLDKHWESGLLLDADPYVDLYQLNVNPSTFLCLTNNPTVQWNGLTWENFPIELTGVSVRSSGEFSRPQLRLGNVMGVLSYFISTGVLFRGSLRRYRVLKTDLDAGVISFVTSFWDISHTVSLTKDFAVLNLRSPMDRQDYKLPARQYYPPEFPYVRLG